MVSVERYFREQKQALQRVFWAFRRGKIEGVSAFSVLLFSAFSAVKKL
jgi:hypothetical protein